MLVAYEPNDGHASVNPVRVDPLLGGKPGRFGGPIDQRTNHALYISHYPQGRDATVNYPDIDLKFVNDTDNWLLLRTFVGKTFGPVSAAKRVVTTRTLRRPSGCTCFSTDRNGGMFPSGSMMSNKVMALKKIFIAEKMPQDT